MHIEAREARRRPSQSVGSGALSACASGHVVDADGLSAFGEDHHRVSVDGGPLVFKRRRVGLTGTTQQSISSDPDRHREDLNGDVFGRNCEETRNI